MRGDWPTRAEYEAQQQMCAGGSCPSVDDELCSYVFIEDFDTMLGSLDVDVLAIFAEKDLNIDWRKTLEFYEATIGQNDEASLAIEVFDDADHNLNISETGSILEMRSMTAPQKSDGYYDVQVVWLQRYVVGSSEDE